jgi:hypothetical protein
MLLLRRMHIDYLGYTMNHSRCVDLPIARAQRIITTLLRPSCRYYFLAIDVFFDFQSLVPSVSRYNYYRTTYTVLKALYEPH